MGFPFAGESENLPTKGGERRQPGYYESMIAFPMPFLSNSKEGSFFDRRR